MHIPFCIIKKQKDQREILTIIWGILGKTGIKTENKGDNRMNEMFELEGTALMIHLPAEVIIRYLTKYEKSQTGF